MPQVVEPAPLPDYLQDLKNILDKDKDGNIDQEEFDAAKMFLCSPGLKGLIQLFDVDGDGEIDEDEVKAAKKLVMSMKAAKKREEELDGLEKLDAVKRDEKLARMKAEEKREEAMRREHDKISKKLEERQRKRKAAMGKMEQASKEEELQEKIKDGGGGLSMEAVLGREGGGEGHIDIAALLDDDE
jgi:hypothetical protein